MVKIYESPLDKIKRRAEKFKVEQALSASSIIDEREIVTVIGGGIAACEAALQLCQDVGEDGKTSKQNVIMIAPALFDGASGVATQFHVGNEYPLDWETAKACLNAAIIGKLAKYKEQYLPYADKKSSEAVEVFEADKPLDYFTNVPGMNFLIAEGTENEGALTCAKNVTFCIRLQELYRQKCEEIYEKKKPEWSRELIFQACGYKPPTYSW
jgi:hypothetical protein